MITVTTKEELKKALTNKEPEIEVVGSLAKKIIRQQKIKKGCAWGGVGIGVASLAAAPLTGGLSLFGFSAAATTTAGSLSAAEIITLIAIVGVIGVSFVGALKGYNMEIDIKNARIKLEKK